jgi:uncharacterized protein YjbI with pentapeptide repeats
MLRYNIVNLHSADLRETDLSDADLSGSCLNYGVLLNADLRRAYLSDATLHFANVYSSDLSYATLRFADFYQADLRRANLSYADLSGASLREAQVLNAQFISAVMTGACIEGWHMGRRTNLDQVQCHYIFRKYDPQRRVYLHRQPEALNHSFAPGEFAFRFQVLKSALSVIDLPFTEGIDWQAFLGAFQELGQERSDETIAVRGIERQGETFMVRLEVDAEAEKTAIATRLQELYQAQLARQEESYRESHIGAPEDLASWRQKQASITAIIQTMANADWPSQNAPLPGDDHTLEPLPSPDSRPLR